MRHDADFQQYRRACRRPYVLGIDHVAFAARDLEATGADDRALRRPLPQAAIHSTVCYKGLPSTFLSDSWYWRKPMPQSEQFEALILGSGFGGKLLAWHLAQSGRRTAVVERRWIGGSCPNIACLPSKNEIWSAKVADLVGHAARFGTSTGFATIDMPKVRQRKRDMVEGLIAMHLQRYNSSGAEL